MIDAIPQRFRDPIHNPEPLLAEQYRKLFAHDATAPEPSQVALFSRALLRGDPLADAWCARSLELPHSERQRLFERAATHGIASVEGAPAELVALFRQAETVPLWLDAKRITWGANICRRAGLLGHFVLSDFALLGGYRSSAIAKTLVGTGELRDNAAERLAHTVHYVMSVTEPGAMLPGNPGFAATLQVRMVHARVRRALLQAPHWRTDLWGLPINQADSLGTNLLFSIGLLEGCKQWGLRFTEREADAVIQLWRYIGYVIGVDESLLPSDVESARRALYMVGVSQPDPDEDSLALARAFCAVPLSFVHSPLGKRLIGAEMNVRVSMTRRILGDAAADQLELPRSRLRLLLTPIVAAVSALERARTLLPFGEQFALRAGNHLLAKQAEFLDAALKQRPTPVARPQPSTVLSRSAV
ncbi:MAG: hypothetical protein RL701_6586 [Pseudomonadota bacterium]|jgi:hypothetical protein